MGAEQPALQERDRPVAALYRVVLAPLGLGLDHCLVRSLAQAVVVVAGVPVGHDAGVVCDLTVGEALDGARIIVLDVSEAHPSVRLGGHQNELLVRPALAADERLVDLNERAERLTVRAHHRGAQLVQPTPRRLVGAEAHDALQILTRNAGAACRDLEDRAEPHLERLAGLLQERAGREARLMAAVGALERSALADRPHTRRVAVRTGRLTAPAGLNPIGAAVLFGRKLRLEFRRSLGELTPQ